MESSPAIQEVIDQVNLSPKCAYGYKSTKKTNYALPYILAISLQLSISKHIGKLEMYTFK